MSWLLALLLALIPIGVICAVTYLGIKFPYFTLTVLIIFIFLTFAFIIHDSITIGGF